MLSRALPARVRWLSGQTSAVRVVKRSQHRHYSLGWQSGDKTSRWSVFSKWKTPMIAIGALGAGVFLDYYHREIRDQIMAYTPVSVVLALSQWNVLPKCQLIGLRWLLALSKHESSRDTVADSNVLEVLGELMDADAATWDPVDAEPSAATVLCMCSLVHLASNKRCKEVLFSSAWLDRVGTMLEKSRAYEVHTSAAALLQTGIQCTSDDSCQRETDLRTIATATATQRLLHQGFVHLRSSMDVNDRGARSLPRNKKYLIDACEHLKPVGKDRSALLHRLRLGPEANLQMLATTTLLCSLCSNAKIRDELLESGLLSELNMLVQRWNSTLLVPQNYPCVSRLLYLISLLANNERVAQFVVEHHQWTDHIQDLLKLDDPDIQLFTVILLGALMESTPGGVALLRRIGLAAIVEMVDRMDVDVRVAVTHVLYLMKHHPAMHSNGEPDREKPLGRFGMDENFRDVAR